MRKILVLLLFVSFVFSCDDKKTKRPKSFSEQWNIKGNVKSMEYIVYSVSEKFGEINKEHILENAFYDSDEWIHPSKKSIFNIIGDIEKFVNYDSEGGITEEFVFSFNPDDIPKSYKYEGRWGQGRGDFILDNDGYHRKRYTYNENDILFVIELIKRNSDGQIIKHSIFYNDRITSNETFGQYVWSDEEFIDMVESHSLSPFTVLEWQYDKKGRWVETSILEEMKLVSITKLEYDKLDNRVSHKTYDQNGDLISRWEYIDIDKMGNWTSRIRYDRDNNAEFLQEYKIIYY